MAKIARGTIPGYITRGGEGYSYTGTWKNPTTNLPESIAGYTFDASLHWVTLRCDGGEVVKPSTINIVDEAGGVFTINGSATDVKDIELGPNASSRIILTITTPDKTQLIFVIPIIGEVP